MEQSPIASGLITGLKWGLALGAVFAGGLALAVALGAAPVTLPAFLSILVPAATTTTAVAGAAATTTTAVAGAAAATTATVTAGSSFLAGAGTVLMQSLIGAATLGPIFAGIGGVLGGVSTLYGGYMTNKSLNQQEHIALATAQSKAPKRGVGPSPSHDYTAPASAAPVNAEMSTEKAEKNPAWVSRTSTAAQTTQAPQISA